MPILATNNIDKKTGMILRSFLEGILPVCNNKLKKAVLFGSYARGDYTEESDMDVFLLIDVNDNELCNFNEPFSEWVYEIIDQYGELISLVVESVPYYKRYENSLPLFQNIKREGIVLYES